MKTPGETITEMVNDRRIEEIPENAVSNQSAVIVDQMAVSMAISLKRIADALTGEGENILTAPINQYGEGIGEAIGGQLDRAQMKGQTPQ